MKRLLAATLIALLSTACVEQRVSRYPSLQPRPIERRSNAEAVAVVPTAVPDPVLDRTLADQAKALADADAAFGPAANTAERAARVAQGESAGGERWIAAQAALGKLDAVRTATSATVTDLEEAAINRARDSKPPYAALDALKNKGEAQLAAEINRIADIQRLLPGG
jgi:hypothetical protein